MTEDQISAGRPEASSNGAPRAPEVADTIEIQVVRQIPDLPDEIREADSPEIPELAHSDQTGQPEPDTAVAAPASFHPIPGRTVRDGPEAGVPGRGAALPPLPTTIGPPPAMVEPQHDMLTEVLGPPGALLVPLVREPDLEAHMDAPITELRDGSDSADTSSRWPLESVVDANSGDIPDSMADIDSSAGPDSIVDADLGDIPEPRLDVDSEDAPDSAMEMLADSQPHPTPPDFFGETVVISTRPPVTESPVAVGPVEVSESIVETPRVGPVILARPPETSEFAIVDPMIYTGAAPLDLPAPTEAPSIPAAVDVPAPPVVVDVPAPPVVVDVPAPPVVVDVPAPPVVVDVPAPPVVVDAPPPPVARDAPTAVMSAPPVDAPGFAALDTYGQGAAATPPPVVVAAPATPIQAGQPDLAWPSAPGQTMAPGRIDAGPVPVPVRDSSPLDGFEQESPRGRAWVKPVLIAVGAVVLILGGYVGASFALANQVPRGTEVAGIEIGGLTRDQAADLLTDELADRSGRPVTVIAREAESSIVPNDAGLSLDTQATVDSLTGVNLLDPARVWRHIVGGGSVVAVSKVDSAVLAKVVKGLDGSLAQSAVNASVVFEDGTPHVTNAVDGWTINDTGAVKALTDQWLTEDSVELPTEVSHPQVSQDEAKAALSEQAVPLAKGSVTVDLGDQSATLTTADLTEAASFAVEEGELVLVLDGAVLRDVVVEQLPDLLTPATDAKFDLSSGQPVIVAGVAGTTIDPADLAKALIGSTTTDNRTATVELTSTDPAEGVEELEALHVVEVVSEFSTPLNSEPRRTQNITNGAGAISGTLIRPGEVFSLGEALGPVDGAHGFVEAGAIVDGNHQDAMGGGLSQLSTTSYNAGYLAGMEIIEHKPHSEYFTRYPEGRESTLFYPQLDMKWKNNTPYGALVEAWVADGQVHVRIWGTKHWTVESVTSPRRGVTSPTTVYNESPTCEPQGAGNPGFSVTVTRTTSLNGEVVNTESWDWTYKPQNRIVCSAPPG